MPDTMLAGAESILVASVSWLRLIVEISSAAVIAAGLVSTALVCFSGLRHPGSERFNEARLCFARYLALALELQLGADVLSTAVSPSWDQIGKLGAIAVIRTALNFFLQREMRSEHPEKTGY